MKRATQHNAIVLTFAVIVLLLGACGGGTSGDASAELKADAGADITVKVGDSPEFDGCASTGAVANYKWTIVKAPESMPEYDGKVIREVDANCSYTLEASMIADEVGMWEVELEVSDGAGNSSTDTVAIDVIE